MSLVGGLQSESAHENRFANMEAGPRARELVRALTIPDSLAAALAGASEHAEALAEAVVVVVHHRLVQPLLLMIAHEHGHLVHRDLHIVRLRLIQSQPQTGPTSAIACNGNTKSRPRVFRQDGAQLLARPVGDGHVGLQFCAAPAA